MSAEIREAATSLQSAERAYGPRCPGCGHSCCPRPGMECGGESDVVRACERLSGDGDEACPHDFLTVEQDGTLRCCDCWELVSPPAQTSSGGDA